MMDELKQEEKHVPCIPYVQTRFSLNILDIYWDK